MPPRMLLIAFVALASSAIQYVSAQDDSSWASTEKAEYQPEIHHPNIRSVQLFAQNPDVVTPVGIAVAPDGKVFVQENHTHKRNSNYRGPKTDRILVFEDTNNDGVADKRSVFYEGHTFSTDLLFGPDGHLYVSTRWFIGRFKDAGQKVAAEGEPEILVTCETDGDYPHNGVGGLAIDPANPEWLAFGFGENLGADYKFVGSDGVEWSGGAEGGSTYRCRTDGSELTRQSTGHWNAFGMAFDLNGNLFSTDNDPNATPPNRLLHIIPGADFGYEYRYGRSGRHPLVCWYGENPGTLGMIGALGEAACGLIPHGPEKLLSASWTDNRVDLHSLQPKGASFAATREPFLSGPDDFRPVHFAYSADGKYLYFTDWVKISYPVHGHGRIWRVEFKEPIELAPKINAGRREESSEQTTVEQAIEALGDDDPYLRTEAIHWLSTRPEVLKTVGWPTEGSSVTRAHFAVALKRSSAPDSKKIIPELLADHAPDVRYVGIKWIADHKLQEYESNLKAVLSQPGLTRRDLRATMAALATLASDSKKEFSPDDTLLEMALDETRPTSLRALALQTVKVSHERLTVDVLAELAASDSSAIRREAVRSLVLHAAPERAKALVAFATDESLKAECRADAIAGLVPFAQDHAKLLGALATDKDEVIASEAQRTLFAAGIAKRELAAKPEVADMDGWQALVAQAEGQADEDAGRRLFFHSKLAGCYKCHMMSGRGNSIGPDLTTIRNQSGISSDWLLKHIVNPNAEMAPYYRPQQLLTVDGKIFVGLVIGKEGQKQAYVANDGQIFFVDKDDVEARRELTTSIMPSGLLDSLTASEIRDLIAYLLAEEAAYEPSPSASSSRQEKQRKIEQILSNFETEAALAKGFSSHRSDRSLVQDTSSESSSYSVRSVVNDAKATRYFGTGFSLEAVDLSLASEVKFQIKTDMSGTFNLQVHSKENRASVFQFSMQGGSKEAWKTIVARTSSFSVPPWSKRSVDWKNVDRIQVTAFGHGPYDGKYLQLDDFVASGHSSTREEAEKSFKNVVSDSPSEPVRRGGPILVDGLDDSAAAKKPPPGFRSLFDGETLEGWKPMARLPVPTFPGADFKWKLEGEALERAKKNTGRWVVENGAIVGGQEPPGSGKGAYLVSEEKFGNFELIMDMMPDWKTDSGFLIRALPGGSPGMQILVDHRPQGGIGGFYGNGIAGIHGMPFAIDAKYDELGNPVGMIAANPKGERVELNAKTRAILEFAADVDDFLRVWKWGQWNTVKVRCEGSIPTLTTWVNGLKIAVLDMNELEWENYDKEACAKMLGREGHISLEVHNNNFNHWLGKDRWWPRAVVRWKNIFVRELD